MARTKQTSPLGDRLESSDAPRWSGSEPLALGDFERLFDERTSLTVGLEEELMLLDPETLELAPAAGRVLELLGPDERFGHELREGQIELRTPVSGNAIAAGISLAESRLRLCEHVRGTLLVAGAGTHPFSASWARALAHSPRVRPGTRPPPAPPARAPRIPASASLPPPAQRNLNDDIG